MNRTESSPVDHAYQGAPDRKYCNFEPWNEIDDPVDFCNLPASAHPQAVPEEGDE